MFFDERRTGQRTSKQMPEIKLGVKHWGQDHHTEQTCEISLQKKTFHVGLLYLDMLKEIVKHF